MGMLPEQIAKQVLDISVSKISDYIIPMIKEYKLSKNRIIVIGGGGGASVLVPLVAKKLSFEYKKAEYADVISSIGVATGMIYEEKEKTINNPTPEDVTQLITETKDAAIRKNASPDSLSVQSEYISDRSILRVTVIGNVTLDLNNISSKELKQEELVMIAKDLFHHDGNVTLKHKLGNYCIFTNIYQKKKIIL
jgi:hypothetical protein